ncbi:GerW family sporulation protein [Clostridium hydrogenum]|uniref:GerW family sporulation protein n=1 Tax=Clostridium hydrogenum TaxID=2855764 RepID=UPI001F212195|nr:spore germination protein GerW family protein [Clostridium hydrogenum]
MRAKRDLDDLFTGLEESLKTEIIVGKPIVIGEVILVPISKVILGCSMPNGGSRIIHNNKVNSEFSAGAMISPNAIVVIRNNGVNTLPVNDKINLDKVLKMVPEIVSKVKANKK